jgi:DNA-binding CsgD family transcriptional regulator
MPDHDPLPSSSPPPPLTREAADEGAAPPASPSSPPLKGRRGRPKGTKNGQGRKPRARAIRDKEVKDFRETVALAMAVGGKRSDEIAQTLGISLRKAQELLTDAKRSEIFTSARDFIGESLLPKVLQNLEALLDQGDKDVTMKMAETMALIGAGGAKHIAPWGAPPAPTPGGPLVEETFEAFRLSVTRTQSQSAGHPPSPPEGAARRALPGEIVEAAPSSDREGDDEGDSPR